MSWQISSWSSPSLEPVWYFVVNKARRSRFQFSTHSIGSRAKALMRCESLNHARSPIKTRSDRKNSGDVSIMRVTMWYCPVTVWCRLFPLTTSGWLAGELTEFRNWLRGGWFVNWLEFYACSWIRGWTRAGEDTRVGELAESKFDKTLPGITQIRPLL